MVVVENAAVCPIGGIAAEPTAEPLSAALSATPNFLFEFATINATHNALIHFASARVPQVDPRGEANAVEVSLCLRRRNSTNSSSTSSEGTA